MRFQIEITSVQPIAALSVEIDLNRPGLICVVGTNGTGKTTLAKAILNLSRSDTFYQTSAKRIFDNSSRIRYQVDAEEYLFTYDKRLDSISTRKPVPARVKNLIAVELPAPHGERFTFFRTLAEADEEIRQAVVTSQSWKPVELIEFLSEVYGERRFDDLVEVRFQRGVCCCKVFPDKHYIREDYFSSGEYFLINLYRKVLNKTRLLVIDEIDIALDAKAQAQLANQLRTLCKQHTVTVVFTSHSLALMQTLEPNEIHYLERTQTQTTLSPMSFNGAKSLMFGFKGFDRTILTEDVVLKCFIEYVINRYCSPTFFSYQIILIGPGGQAVGLMRKNREIEFLGPKEQVITVLDGDIKPLNGEPGIHYIPLLSVEKALKVEYHKPGFPHTFGGGELLKDKALYAEFVTSKRLSREEIFKLLCDIHNDAMELFAKNLREFVCRA